MQFINTLSYAFFSNVSLRNASILKLQESQLLDATDSKSAYWTTSCTGVIQDIQYDVSSAQVSEMNLLCEIQSGEMYSLDVAETWVEEQIMEGTLVSGETELLIPEGSLVHDNEDRIEMADAPKISNPHQLKNRRQLSLNAEGDFSVLIVRVEATDKSTSNSIEQLTNSVFGNDPNDPDPVTLKSQYGECSHGKLNFVETSDRDGDTVRIRNGGTTITVNLSTSAGHSMMANAITRELNSQFDVDSPKELAKHVMYCLPPGTLQGVAYAYVNSWNSVYNDDWCMMVSAQMHEIGHNLGLAHSGENGNKYDDKSGMVSQEP